MPRRSQSQSDSPQKHRLTLAQLASYDDVLSDALVDKVNLFLLVSFRVTNNLFSGLLLVNDSEEPGKQISPSEACQ